MGVGADTTGSTDETTEFKGNDVAIVATVCTGGGGGGVGVDMTETGVDTTTSCASGSSVSSGDKVGNTCTGNVVVSS